MIAQVRSSARTEKDIILKFLQGNRNHDWLKIKIIDKLDHDFSKIISQYSTKGKELMTYEVGGNTFK